MLWTGSILQSHVTRSQELYAENNFIVVFVREILKFLKEIDDKS